MAKIGVVGTNYVGLITALTFSHFEHTVTCVDIDEEKVKKLSQGKTPLYEVGVGEALRKSLAKGMVRFSTKHADAVKGSELVFIAVGTPSRQDGGLDPAQLESAARSIGKAMRKLDPFLTIVVKSTVIPGTTEKVILPALEETSQRKAGSFGLAVNPEFLKEGSALRDSLHPDRIVIGTNEERSRKALGDLYAPFASPTFFTDLRTAEMVKYATNAFLATKVSFANELANLCDAFGISYPEVFKGLTMDSRVNPKFLVPTAGFGGSCFPKDLRALVHAGRQAGYSSFLLEAALRLNDFQPQRAVELLEREVGNLKGRRIALLGLSFKGGTDDVRESRALPIARLLVERGAKVACYDPVAMKNFKSLIPKLQYCRTAAEALKGADGCILQADWEEFRKLGEEEFSLMRRLVVVDARRVLDPGELPGLVYRRIGG